jgi:hypothetical protein
MASKLLPVVEQAMPGSELRKLRSDSDQRKALTKQGMDVARSVGEKETPATAPQKTFKQAFKEARDAGKGTFSWNGKKYTTEMAGAKKPAAEETKFESSMPSVMSDEEGTTTSFKRGGKVKMSSASKRGDGCAQRGKTRGKMT